VARLTDRPYKSEYSIFGVTHIVVRGATRMCA